MKKKVKLITTIASLCLAVALMAFGVYAATNTTVNVSGTVTFTVTDVFVKAETTIYKATNAAGKVVADPATATYDEETAYVATNTATSKDGSGNWQAIGDYSVTKALNFADAGAFKIVVKLTNLSVENAITIAATAKSNTETPLVNSTIAAATGNKTSVAKSTSAEQQTSEELVFYVSIADVSKAASGTWDINITLTKGA